MDDLTGPCSVPSEIVILRVGFGEDEAVDAIAVRELTLAAVAVASPDRWLFVEADAWLTEFAWEAAAHIGTRRHMRFIDAVNGVPPGVRITGAQASGNSRRIVAALTGGSPPPTKIQVSRVLPFGSTGGRAAREVSLIKETEDVRRILANDIVYAPRISQLLGPGGFESPFSPPTPLASPSLLLADYPSAFSSIDAHNANALAQSLERVDSKQPRRSTASRAEQAVQSLIGTPPLLIVVFGSAASGTDVPRDVDILVLVSEVISTEDWPATDSM